MANNVPIFRLKSMGSDRVICKHIGNVEQKDEIIDEPLDLNNNILNIGIVGQYEIYAKACLCNIVGNYLINNIKYPIYYMTLLYSKKFVTGYLFTIFLYFTIDDITIKELTTPNKYINRLMTGKYTMEFVADDDFLSKFLEKMKPEIENYFMERYVEQFELSDEEGKARIMETVINDVNNKLNEYRNIFEPEVVTNINKNKVIEKMQNIYNNKNMKDLILFGLNIREKERIEKSCPDQDYTMPKKIINLKELKENPDIMEEKIDEYINDMSDDD